jgi:hypothetical protein
MFRYLKKRRCPRCYYDFVVVVIDCNAWMRRINGFCGKCDHYLDWQLFRSEFVQQSSHGVGLDAVSQNELHRAAPRLTITRKAAVNLKHN